MAEHEIVRVWKDPDGDRTDHPAGEIALEAGGNRVDEEVKTEYLYTMGCCGGLTTPTCFGPICPPV